MTDAQERSAVATCHNLHRWGYRVGAAGSEGPAPAQWSRRAQARYRIPDPRDDGRDFVRRVAEIVDRDQYATLLPGSDASVLAISKNRDLFDDRFALGLPSAEAVARCLSKLELMKASENAGLPTPETIVALDSQQAREGAERLGYPLILKPRSTVFEDYGRMRQHSGTMIRDRQMLDEMLPQFGNPCLLQRCQPGSLLSFAGVIAEDRLLSFAFSRYSRTLPADAGSVSFSQTEEPPLALVERVRRMISSLGWQGVFEIEMIETAPGRFAVIDFNPRLYGSMALAVGAGAPLPAIWCNWLLHGDAAAGFARPGFSYRWEDAEIRNLLGYLRRGRIGAAARVMRPRRHSTHAYFSWKDPAPFMVRTLGGVLKKSAGKKRAARSPAPETDRRARIEAWKRL